MGEMSKKILIVEDEHITATSIQIFLRKKGYDVPGVVVRGEDVLGRVEEWAPDLILMDIHLQGSVDGIEAAGQVLEKYDIPVIYLTAFSDDETLARVKLTAPWGYILKPIERRVLLTTVEMTLYKHDMERQLRIREERLTMALEATSDGLWDWNLVTGAVFFSPRYFRMLGYEPGDFEPSYESWKGLVHPADIDRVEGLIQAHIREQVGYEVEFRMRRQDGSWCWILARGKVMDRAADGTALRLVGTHQDITSRKDAEQALRQSEERYRVLAEALPEGIFVEQVQHERTCLVYVNPAGLRMLGYDSLEDLGRVGFNDVFGGDYSPRDVYLSMDDTDFSPVFEGVLQRRDGTVLDVEVIFMKTVFEGIPALLGAARDVTELKSLRDKADRMAHLAALGELSATIAHEIRNPLGSVSLNLEYLADRFNMREEEPEACEDTRVGIQRIQKIIKGILDYARPSMPQLREEDIHLVLDSSVHAVESAFRAGEVMLIRNYAEGLPMVMVDANQLVQVFVNLFMNAMQSMPAGGEVMVTTGSANGFVEIQIEDAGKGISEADLERIFNPFFTTRTDGIGLGLAVVFRIIEQHHGRIFVESEVGEGTTFTIRLPCVGE